MDVRVNLVLQDDARNAVREFSITLTEADGKEMFKNHWDTWTIPTKVQKLRAMGDIMGLQYAASRGFRDPENVAKDIEIIIAKDLQ